jgi:hypothetical protein
MEAAVEGQRWVAMVLGGAGGGGTAAGRGGARGHKVGEPEMSVMGN